MFFTTKKALVLFLLAGLQVAPVSNAMAGECDDVTGEVPKMICEDDELKKLDMEWSNAIYHANRLAPDSGPGDYGFRVRSDIASDWRDEHCKTRECIRDWFDLQTRQMLTYQKNHKQNPWDPKNIEKKKRQQAMLNEYFSYAGSVSTYKDWRYDSTVKPHVVSTMNVTGEMQFILRTDNAGLLLLNKDASTCESKEVKIQFSKNTMKLPNTCKQLGRDSLFTHELQVTKPELSAIKSAIRRGRSMQISFVPADGSNATEIPVFLFSLMGYSLAQEAFTADVYGIEDLNSLNKKTQQRVLPVTLFNSLGKSLSEKSPAERKQILTASSVKSPVQPKVAAARKPRQQQSSHAIAQDYVARYAAAVAAQLEQAWHPACSAFASHIRTVGNSGGSAYAREMQIDRMIDKVPSVCVR